MYQFIDEAFLLEAGAITQDRISDAVKNKRVVTIAYKGEEEDEPGVRTIEPSCFGEDKKGRMVIRAWQRAGKSVTGINPPPVTKGWKWFLVSRISSWNESSNLNFTTKRPKYNTKGDKHMSKIFAISDFDGKIKISPLPKTPKKPTPVKKPGIVGKKSSKNPKGTISTTVVPTGKEYKSNEKMRDPQGMVKTFFPTNTKKVKVALSPEEYREIQDPGKLKDAVKLIADKVKSPNKEVFIDISGMDSDKIIAFSKSKINVMESLLEQVEWFSYNYEFPVISKRFMTLTEILNSDLYEDNHEEQED